MTDWVLAIDFGTTFTSAAIRVDGRAVLVRIHSPEGPRDVMPSAVFLPPDRGELVVGWVAENQAVLAPDRFEPTPKRRLGVDEHLLLGGEPAPVVAAVAAVLDRVFSEAKRSRGDTEPSLVSLTHPASWAGARVEALVEAAHRAGIRSPHLLSEPEAAAMHFATERVGTGGLVAVYDLGGGTFDAAVLERVGEASFRLAGRPGGRDGLGGEEFDRKLYEHVAKQLAFEAPDHWARIRDNARSHRDFRIEVRRAKEALSYHASHDLYLPEAQDRLSWRVTREEFEDLIRPDLDASVEILARTLAEAGIGDPSDHAQLADVYLAGGSSRIPLVAQAIGERLGRVPRSLDEPKSVVALGASNVRRAGEPAPAPQPLPPPSRDVPAPAPAPVPAVAEPPPAPTFAAVPAAEPEPAVLEPAPTPRPEPRRRVAVGDALVVGLALVGAAVALFGTAVASARGIAPMVTSAPAGWSALEAVGVPVAVLAALVALRTAHGGRLREVGVLLGLGVQMTLGASGWLLYLIRRGDDYSPTFQYSSPSLAVPTLVGALLVLAAAVVAWRSRSRTDEPAVETGRRARRVAAVATLVGSAAVVAAVFLWPGSDHYDRLYRIESWFVVEPIGAAACAIALAVLLALSARSTPLVGGALLAFGLQTVLYFVPHVGPYLAQLDRPSGPAGALGVAGALLVTGAGLWLWRASEGRARRTELRWPALLTAAGAFGVLAGFAVSSTRSWPALMRPDGGGVPSWPDTTWHFLEAVAVPVLVGAALIAVVRARERRAFPAGALLGFGAQTVAATVAALVYADRGQAPRGILAVVVLAAVVLAAGSAAVVYRVRRDADVEADRRALWPWAGMLGLAAAGGVAVSLFLADLRDQFDEGRSFRDVNDWLILEPAVAAGLLAGAAIVLLVRRTQRPLAAGVLAAVGAQTLLWFSTPIGVSVSEPFDIVSLGVGSVIGALAALAGTTAGVLARRRAAAPAVTRPAVVQPMS